MSDERATGDQGPSEEVFAPCPADAEREGRGYVLFENAGTADLDVQWTAVSVQYYRLVVKSFPCHGPGCALLCRNRICFQQQLLVLVFPILYDLVGNISPDGTGKH